MESLANDDESAVQKFYVYRIFMSHTLDGRCF
jgi:hypothetical protein